MSFGTILDTELLLWLRAALRPLDSPFGNFSPRGARSKGDQQLAGRAAHNQEASNILGVDTKILAARVLAARKTRKLQCGLEKCIHLGVLLKDPLESMCIKLECGLRVFFLLRELDRRTWRDCQWDKLG